MASWHRASQELKALRWTDVISYNAAVSACVTRLQEPSWRRSSDLCSKSSFCSGDLFLVEFSWSLYNALKAESLKDTHFSCIQYPIRCAEERLGLWHVALGLLKDLKNGKLRGAFWVKLQSSLPQVRVSRFMSVSSAYFFLLLQLLQLLLLLRHLFRLMFSPDPFWRDPLGSGLQLGFGRGLHNNLWIWFIKSWGAKKFVKYSFSKTRQPSSVGGVRVSFWPDSMKHFQEAWSPTALASAFVRRHRSGSLGLRQWMGRVVSPWSGQDLHSIIFVSFKIVDVGDQKKPWNQKHLIKKLWKPDTFWDLCKVQSLLSSQKTCSKTLFWALCQPGIFF